MQAPSLREGSQAQDLNSSIMAGEAFGMVVGKRFCSYTNYVRSKLRANFDCLLAMFWKDQNTKPVADAQIGLWRANQVLTAAPRSARTMNDSVPI